MRSIDKFLPQYHFSEKHERVVLGSLEQAYKAFQTLDFTSSLIIKILFFFRGIRTTQQMRQMFVTLVDDPPHQFIQCLVARPWTVGGNVLPIAASDFTAFDKAGFAKVVWEIRFEEEGLGCRIQTETRIQCTDSSSQRKFGFYWFFIRPFSGLIRWEILRMIAKNVEG